MASSLHDMIRSLKPSLKKVKTAKEKLDFVDALTDAIAQSENSAELIKIQVRLKTTLATHNGLLKYQVMAEEILAIEKEFSVPERDFGPERCDISAEVVANELLAEDEAAGLGGARQGQMALKALYRFIAYNAEWIQVWQFLAETGCSETFQSSLPSSGLVPPAKSALSSSTGRPSSPAPPSPSLIQPWGADTQPQPDPHDMMTLIGRSHVLQEQTLISSSSGVDNSGGGVFSMGCGGIRTSP